jgi:hypothetical protein
MGSVANTLDWAVLRSTWNLKVLSLDPNSDWQAVKIDRASAVFPSDDSIATQATDG